MHNAGVQRDVLDRFVHRAVCAAERRPEEIAEVVATLESGWLSTGPRVAAFERAFAGYVGAPHAIAVNSCTAALHLSLLACGVEPGDEVITTPLTFCATANVIVHAGATPVFADIDPVDVQSRSARGRSALTERTRVILPVHYAGRPADMTAFRRMARAAGLRIVEDAAHCVEGVADGARWARSATSPVSASTRPRTSRPAKAAWSRRPTSAAASFMRTASLHGMSRDAWTRYAPGGIAALRRA